MNKVKIELKKEEKQFPIHISSLFNIKSNWKKGPIVEILTDEVAVTWKSPSWQKIDDARAAGETAGDAGGE